MKEILFVGLGGALGAILRYGLGLLPVKSELPIITMLINIAGAFFIGCIVAYAKEIPSADPQMVLFLKTGFCGGFTTFSTFSLETMQLLDANKYGYAITYALCSLLLCILGVAIGRWFMDCIILS